MISVCNSVSGFDYYGAAIISHFSGAHSQTGKFLTKTYASPRRLMFKPSAERGLGTPLACIPGIS